MLRVRQDQLSLFEGESYLRWAEKVREEVRRCWPLLDRVSDEALLARLAQAARAGHQLGLETSEQWLRYANVALALGDDFAQEPEAQRILGAPTPAGVRLEKLVSWAFVTLRGGGR